MQPRKTLAPAAVLALLALASACESPTESGPGAPSLVEILSGDLQTNVVAGSELPDALVVRVLDDRGKPLRNQLVSFVVTAGGGSVFAGAALTNADGEARERWRLGTVAGAR
jgi:hypothetical protein